ncbi:MAG: argininosuccinate lyase, partial [Actinobacteria bacterium]|nr:argininosuccinate lyase [Actinomycetota bacterium]
GVPVQLDGMRIDPVTLLKRIGAAAGAHGFGRVDMIENRLVGIKSREVYEVPGALALIAAHRDLESMTLEREVAHEKAGLERRWAELAYYGQWHGPLHASLRAFMESTQASVTGEVRLRFHKGTCTVVGRRSDRALYDLGLATYEAGADSFDHRHAEGFVRLWSLPLRQWAKVNGAQAAAPDLGTREAEPRSGVEPGTQEAETIHAATPAEGNGEVATTSKTPAPLWAGRFAEPPSAGTIHFTASLHFDRRLAPFDLRATAAHAEALRDAGILSADETTRILDALGAMGAEIEAGTFAWTDDEDVHTVVERALTDRLGALGAKIHAARSRNDLVATDLRLWSIDAARSLANAAAGLAEALAARAAEHSGAIMPGYTHLQRAQPVTLGHHLLAHAFPLVRDAERLLRAAEAAGTSPLGAGALAGSTITLDTDATAGRLGLAGAFENSIDAVSDRDFALELLSACAITAVHLSRLAEDLVLWLAVTMKGLPLAYDRDLQEDKEPLFDAYDTLAGSLGALTAMVAGMEFDTDRMRQAAEEDGMLLATDVAEQLVAGGMPFRDAHHLVGTLVAKLEADGRGFADLSSEEWAGFSPLLADGVTGILSAERAVQRRTTPGGPSPQSVRDQIDTVRTRSSAIRDRAGDQGLARHLG